MHSNPPQCSCLEDPADRRTWWATVHGGSQKFEHDKHFHFSWEKQRVIIVLKTELAVCLWKSVPCAFNYLLIFFFKCSIKSTATGCRVSWDTQESKPEPGGGQGSDPGAGAGCGCQAFMACSRRSDCGMFSTKPLEGSGRPALSLKPGVFASQTGGSPKKRQLRLYMKRSP